MNFIKQIFKPKNKPYFEREANEKYAELFQKDLTKLNTGNDEKVYGIIQEIFLNNQIVISAIFRDNFYQHININGKVSSMTITNKVHNRNTKKVFNKCDDEMEKIDNYELKADEYLKNNGIRLTFLSNINAYQKFGSHGELSKGKFIPHILVHFSNLLRIFEKKRIDKIIIENLKNSR